MRNRIPSHKVQTSCWLLVIKHKSIRMHVDEESAADGSCKQCRLHSLKIDDGLRWKERGKSGAIEGNQVTKYIKCTSKDI